MASLDDSIGSLGYDMTRKPSVYRLLDSPTENIEPRLMEECDGADALPASPLVVDLDQPLAAVAFLIPLSDYKFLRCSFFTPCDYVTRPRTGHGVGEGQIRLAVLFLNEPAN